MTLREMSAEYRASAARLSQLLRKLRNGERKRLLRLFLAMVKEAGKR